MRRRDASVAARDVLSSTAKGGTLRVLPTGVGSESSTFGARGKRAAGGQTRVQFFRNAVVVGGAVVGGGALAAGLARAQRPSAAQDRKILNFALLLEYLQASFYEEALASGGLRGELREFATVVGEHEQAHVAFLRKALGAQAAEKPTFAFGDSTRQRRFAAAAVALEDTAVAAYNGQAANLTKATLAAAATIVSVEGRHAAWIRDIAGEPPAPRAADPGIEAAQATRKLRTLGLQ